MARMKPSHAIVLSLYHVAIFYATTAVATRATAFFLTNHPSRPRFQTRAAQETETHPHNNKKKRLLLLNDNRTRLYEKYYTKGAEIYPACNKREFTLADSFPNGVIPLQARSILQEKNIVVPTTSVPSYKEEEAYGSRRNFMMLGISSAVTAAVAGTLVSQRSAVTTTTTTTTASVVPSMSLSDAIEWLDVYCDRRFLHAIVASDYRFLYYGLGEGDGIRTQTFEPDLLSVETYGTQQAVDYFQRLESAMEQELVKPSRGHLMTTSIKDAQQWGSGSAASMWPISGAHYAWFQDKQVFYPRMMGEDTKLLGDDGLLIVDGKDCGRESLEDALRAEHCEIMVSADHYLVVPAMWNEELRRMLQSSFLV